ncbi:MAG: outer membrane protein assembly factor BamD [Bdellovibrionaceae bacterium]|nr:outer membrane protein assembly factor BamD [Pseudobdellovibrionaceae bacterium]MBX3034136.1 outer membrane protein assembly factor BamD [Pseudobdellovibrionaceae bacterium]
MLRVIIALFLMSSLLACSSVEKKSDTPEGLFSIAQELEESDRYELAILRYNDVKNKFPYSSWATKAELAIADVHYKAESWPEAQVSYQAFRELHPTHPQIAYVVFRLGMSYYNQMPETVDRDLTLAKDAIDSFDEVIRRHPGSEYAAEAREKKEDSLKRLAGKEEYIADFYFKRGFYGAALPRYEGLLRNYPNLGFDAKALSRAAIAANKADHKEKAREYLQLLKGKFPDSSELNAARREIE